jgi:hypothetical protein
MTKDEAKDYLPLFQALAEGKTIQIKEDDGTWADLYSPSFLNDPCFYRIKPEPRVIWVNEDADGHIIGHYSKEWANRCVDSNTVRVAVRYVEMPEDTSNQ